MKMHKLVKSIGGRFPALRLAIVAAMLGSLVATNLAMASPLLTQSFISDKPITPGSIVSLKQGSTDSVEPTNNSNTNNILGVVIDGSQTPVTLGSGDNKQIQISTSGVENVLVTDMNGDIKAGDSITGSPISGVGMRTTANSKVVGVAQDKFPNSTASQEDVKDKGGKTSKVKIGQVPVLINVTYFYKEPEKTVIPQAFQDIANTLAGKKVSPLPILISVAIFIVTLIVVVSIVYSMIHSSIISVGRNPLSQAAVYRNVIQLSVLVVFILGVAVAAIYLVLRKF